MACPPQDITDTELSILHALWDRGSMTTREITDILYPEGTVSHYATVQSLLLRLEEKGIVSRARSERTHVFTAAVGRDEIIGRRLRTLAKQLCDGSLSPLLTHLVKARKLTSRERAELRSLLDDLDTKAKARKQRP
ncbi:MAG TPA: BlaI/MecI/CopY family transcriptional regulator [Planctomycetota bacterium]|nr:BlaI/MecI/CopY family transcriptional regulator [Planctomycetota bacterium]